MNVVIGGASGIGAAVVPLLIGPTIVAPAPIFSLTVALSPLRADDVQIC